MRFVNDTAITINTILPLNEDCLQLTYTPIEDVDESMPTTSIVHAAFTTCHGRLLLYKYLDIVGERAAYHDTGMLISYE